MPTLSCSARHFILVLLVAATSHAQQLKIDKSITVGGNSVSKSETSISGPRERIVNQATTGNTLTIRQCDLKQTVHINEQGRAYLIVKDAQGDSAPKPAAMVNGATPAGYITETAAITDTGERKTIYGYPARHLKVRVKTESSQNACSQVNQSYEVDGWYTDIGKEMSACDEFLRPVSQAEGCNDRVIRKRSGSGKPGYPLSETITMHGVDGSSMEIVVRTSEITKLDLEPSLFDIPPGFREVKSYAELNSPPAPQVQQQASTGAAAPVGQKPAGKMRIGIAPPDAQVGQGSNMAQDYSTPIRNAEMTLMNGPVVDIVPLDAHIAMQLQAEAQQKQCDFVMFLSVVLKRSQGALGKWGKIGSMAASAAPVGMMAHGVAGVAAAQAANVVVSQIAQQQAMHQLATFNGQVKSKDDVTVQYQLLPAGQDTPTLQGTLQGKAKTDGEDVLTSMLTQTANAVLTQVSLITPNSPTK